MRFLFTALVFGLGLSAWAQNASSPSAGSGGVKTYRNLPYVPAGDERQKLDLYLPEKVTAPAPLIVWIHGGGWRSGSKEFCPAYDFVQEGYAVASIGYRLSDTALFPAQIQDCKAAIRFLRAHAAQLNLDPQRFGVWGNSAGGHLAALLGTSSGVESFNSPTDPGQSGGVQAVCVFYGPADFPAFVQTTGFESHAAEGSPESRLLGSAVMSNLERAQQVSPVSYLSADDPPFLIVHGTNDPVVPWQQSQLLFEGLQRVGVSAHFHTIHGGEHGGTAFNSLQVRTLVAQFFATKLRNLDRQRLATTSDTTAPLPEAAPVTAPMAATSPRLPQRYLPPGTAISGMVRSPNPRTQEERFVGPARQVRGIISSNDQNGDGQISQAEWKHDPAVFKEYDYNDDGFISPQDERSRQMRLEYLERRARQREFNLKNPGWRYRNR